PTMYHRLAFFAVALFLFPCAVHVAWGDDNPSSKGLGKAAPDGKEIERLVKKLGSVEFKEREAARNALGQIGKPRLTALRKAAKDRDPEIRSRAAKLILALQDDLARPIDLGPHVNQKLNEQFHNYHPGNDLASLPTGRQTFAGVKFTVGKGVVQLGAGKPSSSLLFSGNRHAERVVLGRHVVEGDHHLIRMGVLPRRQEQLDPAELVLALPGDLAP